MIILQFKPQIGQSGLWIGREDHDGNGKGLCLTSKGLALNWDRLSSPSYTPALPIGKAQQSQWLERQWDYSEPFDTKGSA